MEEVKDVTDAEDVELRQRRIVRGSVFVLGEEIGGITDLTAGLFVL